MNKTFNHYYFCLPKPETVNYKSNNMSQINMFIVGSREREPVTDMNVYRIKSAGSDWNVHAGFMTTMITVCLIDSMSSVVRIAV